MCSLSTYLAAVNADDGCVDSAAAYLREQHGITEYTPLMLAAAMEQQAVSTNDQDLAAKLLRRVAVVCLMQSQSVGDTLLLRSFTSVESR